MNPEIPANTPTSVQTAPPLARLLAGLPEGEPDSAALLDGFFEYVRELGLELYPAQEEAILELCENRHVLLSTPTGSGKTMVALFLIWKALAEGRSLFYTCPIKALVNEKFFWLCDVLGPEKVGMLTGDAAVNRDAAVIVCTAEILSNIALRDEARAGDYVVMDEFHFYGDKERGAAWQIPLVTLQDSVFLLMSATLGDTSQIERELARFTAREVTAVRSGSRPVPLEFEWRDVFLHEAISGLVAAGEAPVYLVNFTQRACAEVAQSLCSIELIDKPTRARLADELSRVRFTTPYGKELSRFLRAGVGVHHAGLLPRHRLLVEKLAQTGLLQVVSGTDSLGVGVNIPIRTVLFSQLYKYDGERSGLLTARQFHQIAGRAGRKGFDDHGRVVAIPPEHVVENKRLEQKVAKNPHLKKKVVWKRPPPHRFVMWDRKVFDRLTASPPEPLVPVLEVTHGMLVHVLRGKEGEPGGGYRTLVHLLRRCHLPLAERRRQLLRAAQLTRSLIGAGIIHLRRGTPERRAAFVVEENLQLDFSLNHALSLYLVETLALLDREAETYALDALSLVESILEDPTVILLRQTDSLKDTLMAQMKADGVEYEERMRRLDEVHHPKPLCDFVYETFNAFAGVHPWVGREAIRPKSVAREMYEKLSSFNDYVLDYGLQRSEGVLLRYLSQVYKTLLQTVPEDFRDERLDAIIDHFHVLIHETDASLVEEWESRFLGAAAFAPDLGLKDETPDILADRRSFTARVRAELHRLLRALAHRDYEGALELVLPGEVEWDAEKLEEALAPYFEDHGSIDVSPRGRQARHTILRELGLRRFSAIQRLVDPDGEADWGIHCEVDVRAGFDPERPLITLVSIAE